MSRRKTHELAGCIAGGATAFVMAPKEELLPLLAETLGGTLAGKYGGIFPDWLEPALSSWHRGPAHSMTAGACVVAGVKKLCVETQAWFRKAADEMTQWASMEQNELLRLLLLMGVFFLRMLAGAVVGAPAGYVSHLVCDAPDRRGLPFIAHGV